MSKFLDSNGVRYLWEKIKSYVEAHSGGGKADSVDWGDIQNIPDNLVYKDDISSVYRYKGSVDNYASLLSKEEHEVGDVWDVKETDMNYAWDGSNWDPLGQTFKIESISNQEINEIVGDG